MNLANQPARSVTKESQLYSKRQKLTQRMMGDISNKVDKQLKARSEWVCELCRSAPAVERAHITGRKQLTHKTTMNDLLHLCVPCHRWMDGTPEGIRYKSTFKTQLEEPTCR